MKKNDPGAYLKTGTIRAHRPGAAIIWGYEFHYPSHFFTSTYIKRQTIPTHAIKSNFENSSSEITIQYMWLKTEIFPSGSTFIIAVDG